MQQEHSLETLKVYKSAMTIGESCWELADKWDSFAKQTLGNQLVRTADSIAANISEGYGRYSFKENKLFCYYARGSLYETRTWLKKAHKRGLMSDDLYQSVRTEVDICGRMLNAYIRTIGLSKPSHDQ